MTRWSVAASSPASVDASLPGIDVLDLVDANINTFELKVVLATFSIRELRGAA